MQSHSTRLLVAFVLAAAVLVLHPDFVAGSKGRVKRAIGGQGFQRGTWPWLVLLKATIVTDRLFGSFPTRHYHLVCGGALISDQWVITAAHCFKDNGEAATRPSNWKASLATVRLRPSIAQRILNFIGRVFRKNDLRTWEVDVDRIVIHPNYNRTSFLSDDLALIRLSDPVPNGRHFSLIQAIPLPSYDEENFPYFGQMCKTKGWGCTSRDEGPSHLAQQVDLPIISDTQCSQYYSVPTTDKRFCAGYRNRGVGVCRGDSGSPLVCQNGDHYALAGIVSFTSRDNPASYPAVFTRVQNYIPWINSVMQTYN